MRMRAEACDVCDRLGSTTSIGARSHSEWSKGVYFPSSGVDFNIWNRSRDTSILNVCECAANFRLDVLVLNHGAQPHHPTSHTSSRLLAEFSFWPQRRIYTESYICTLINASMNYMCLGLPPWTDNNFNVNWWVESCALCARHSYVWSVEWWFCIELGKYTNRMNKKTTHDSWRKTKNFCTNSKWWKAAWMPGWCLAVIWHRRHNV